MLTITLTRGLPASGKTTWALNMIDQKQGGCKRVNKDDLRAMLDNNKHSKGREQFVKKIRNQIIWTSLEEGKHVIVDDTNLDPVHENDIRDLARLFSDQHGKPVMVKIEDFTHVPIAECIRRDKERISIKHVGEKTIRAMARQYLEPIIRPVRSNDGSLSNCLVVDINTIGIKQPIYLNTDSELNLSLINLVNSYSSNHDIFWLVKGDENQKTDVINWLRQHGVYFEKEHVIINSEWDNNSWLNFYEQEIAEHYYLDFVITDDREAIDFWRGQIMVDAWQLFNLEQKISTENSIIKSRRNNENLPLCLVADLDGTTRILNGRNPYDASTCEQDLPNHSVINLINLYSATHIIFLFSGCSEEYREPTENWLRQQGVNYEPENLVMRKAGDFRADNIVKYEMFERYIDQQFYIDFVLDDRNQMVDMWYQKVGVDCLQVYYGDF